MFSWKSINILLVVALAAVVQAQDGRERRPNPRSCMEAQMCCQGQNNTCFVFGRRVDRQEEEEGKKLRCYCDSNCIIMGDCCMDYYHTCKSVDCAVGEWSEWSDCNNGCGYGASHRIRTVSQYPDNGGRHCPRLKQRRACMGYDKNTCMQQSVEVQHELLLEKANILPLEFGEYRADKKWNAWKGILKNLYHDYFNTIFTRPTYRSRFVVKRTHKGCVDTWADALKVNSTVCVECQPIAMQREVGMRCKGHGVPGSITRWSAVDVDGCHGEWELIEGTTPEVCNIVGEESFIFL